MFTPEEEQAIKEGLPLFLAIQKVEQLKVVVSKIQSARDEETSKALADINDKYKDQQKEANDNLAAAQDKVNNLLGK